MDVVQIEKTNENFRLIYDVKGRFTVHRITNQEAKYKLCRVKAEMCSTHITTPRRVGTQTGGVPAGERERDEERGPAQSR